MKQIPNFTKGMFDVNIVLENLNIKNDSIILDAGCGNGYMIREFAKIIKDKGKVYGVDKNIDFVNQLNKQNNLKNVEILILDLIKKANFKDESFDLIYLSTLLHIFSKEEKISFFNEAKRLLKKSAKLAIVEVNKNNTSFGPPLAMRISPNELIKIASLTPKKLIELNENFYMQIFEK